MWHIAIIWLVKLEITFSWLGYAQSNFISKPIPIYIDPEHPGINLAFMKLTTLLHTNFTFAACSSIRMKAFKTFDTMILTNWMMIERAAGKIQRIKNNSYTNRHYSWTFKEYFENSFLQSLLRFMVKFPIKKQDFKKRI